VVVSAAVLVIVVLGVMAASDAVSGTAGANKARTVAATLAEKDQEELRSLRTADLNQLSTYIPADRTVTVDGVAYTIHSEAVWVADMTGEDISCEVPEGDGSYLRISSTVSSPMSGARVKPVTMSSIVAPQPGSGTLSAMVKDADDRPVVNMPVQASAVGLATQTRKTNDAGCAVFSLLEAGSYDVKVDNAGWVDPEGNQLSTQTATVNPGILSTVEFVYDLAARINPANIVSRVNGTLQMDEGNGVLLAHSGLQTGFRTWPGSPTAAVFAPDKLFPFRDPYKIYAGQCTGADPELYDGSYFEDNPTATPKLNRGENFGRIDVLEPATRLVVRRGTASSSTTRSNARVYAYPTHASCSGQRIDMGATLSTPAGSVGTLMRPGLPFGDYRFCTQWTDTSFNPARTWHVFPTTVVQNRIPTGATALTTLLIPTSPSGGNGTCPATA